MKFAAPTRKIKIKRGMINSLFYYIIMKYLRLADDANDALLVDYPIQQVNSQTRDVFGCTAEPCDHSHNMS